MNDTRSSTASVTVFVGNPCSCDAKIYAMQGMLDVRDDGHDTYI